MTKQPPSGLLATSFQPTFTATPLTPTASPLPPTQAAPTSTATSLPTPTAAPPLEPLPVFSSALLRSEVVSNGYLENECEYLRLRWTGSPPHTVVVPIMFHSIVKDGRAVKASQDISEPQFHEFVQTAKMLGFETITTAELESFLYQNAPIPEKSMVLIVDDRRPGVIQDHFLPVLQENNWTVTLAWISADNGYGLWAQMEALNESGYLDVQAHGFRHKYITSTMPEEEIWEEITTSIPILEEHFGQSPLAYIWPGGNYTLRAVEMARQAGYRLGFTVHSPTPIRFNWIPMVQASVSMNDPLMMLPRAWSSEANFKLRQAVKVAEEAKAFALESYAREAAWFRSVCGGELPPLEQIYSDLSVP